MNLYWPIYLNLENELIDLSNKIHIDDKQLDVYSPLIADLIIRCAVEVEAISKEMYMVLDKDNQKKVNELKFDADCIDYLDKTWGICNKEVSIKAMNFYFTKDENKVLRPLHNTNKGKKWVKAYPNLKFDCINDFCMSVGGIDLMREVFYGVNLQNAFNAMKNEFILNVNQVIYK